MTWKKIAASWKNPTARLVPVLSCCFSKRQERKTKPLARKGKGRGSGRHSFTRARCFFLFFRAPRPLVVYEKQEQRASERWPPLAIQKLIFHFQRPRLRQLSFRWPLEVEFLGRRLWLAAIIYFYFIESWPKNQASATTSLRRHSFISKRWHSLRPAWENAPLALGNEIMVVAGLWSTFRELRENEIKIVNRQSPAFVLLFFRGLGFLEDTLALQKIKSQNKNKRKRCGARRLSQRLVVCVFLSATPRARD